jgi:hypothetical protein
MDFLTSIRDRLERAKQNLFRVPETARQVDAAWYAGMAIRPADFSQQLANLQTALQRKGPESETSPEKTAEMVRRAG